MKKIWKPLRGKIGLLLALGSLPFMLEIGIADSLTRSQKSAAILAIAVLCWGTAAALWISAWRYLSAPLSRQWAQWNGRHDTPAQQKRMRRAKNPGFSLVSLDRDMAAAVIQDDHRYRTTLTFCSCPDYQKRHLPCKHMYFLAHELSLQELDG